MTPGNKLSVFSAMVTFLQVKTSERMSNKSFDAMLAAFRKSFPDVSELPHTYSKMKNFLRAVGIGYDMIHVCNNNYVLYKYSCIFNVYLPFLKIGMLYLK